MSSTPLLSDLKTKEHTIPLSGSLAVRIYSDTRPNNLLIADLQKGLILVYDGVELIGEGAGFGTPVLLYSHETYFSGTSQVSLSLQGDSVTLCKEFFMDRVPRRGFRGVDFENHTLRAIFRHLDRLYQRHRNLRLLLSTNPYAKLGAYIRFVEKAAVGKVIVTYSINQNCVHVKMEFSPLKRRDLKKIVVLNEQSSRFFRRYLDSNGTGYVDEEIGEWEAVKADRAMLMDQHSRVGFCLRRAKEAIMHLGREYRKNELDWIGLDYEIAPETETFEYEISLLEGNPI